MLTALPGGKVKRGQVSEFLSKRKAHASSSGRAWLSLALTLKETALAGVLTGDIILIFTVFQHKK